MQILLTDNLYAAACKPALQQILDEENLDVADIDHGNWDAFLKIEGKLATRAQVQ